MKNFKKIFPKLIKKKIFVMLDDPKKTYKMR